jgi:hypothetical protein
MMHAWSETSHDHKGNGEFVSLSSRMVAAILDGLRNSTVPAGPPPEALPGPEVRVRFILPVVDNEGRPFPVNLLVDVVRTIIPHAAGGVTFLPAAGAWYRDGEFSVDESIQVEVATGRVDLLRKILTDTAQRLRQEVIFAVVSDCGRVEHIVGDGDTPNGHERGADRLH